MHNEQNRHGQTFAPCFPLESLLLAINRTRIDYFSLDIEGAEMDVLKTIPWNKLDIRVVSVEYLHQVGGKQSLVDFMGSKGFAVHADVEAVDFARDIFAYDYIFVKKA